MRSSIKDITPEHHPVAMLRDSMPKAEQAVAGFVVLLDKDDTLYWESCGGTKKDLLWAIEQMRVRLMTDEDM